MDTGIIRSTGNTKGPMLVAVGMNLVHILGNSVAGFSHFRPSAAGEVAKVGLPMFFSSASWTMSQVVIFSLVATMGAEQLAARTYLNTLESFSFLAGWSFAMAVQIQVAHLFGAGQMERAYRSLYKALFWG